ncbi:transcription factor MYB83-like [Mangifera indica]|uniref:transcription factor MYB83-like n=1 Tax=Mangifera indica TaxID=29780 RepID=UPI001CFAF907|nr:transcription factor MYB83-like [Mangifera indica]
MGHHSCCNQQKVKRGLWSPEEDEKLIRYITTHGYGCWSEVPEKAVSSKMWQELSLKMDKLFEAEIRRGRFTPEEERLIISLHSVVGNSLNNETWNSNQHQVQALPPSASFTTGMNAHYLPPLTENMESMVPIDQHHHHQVQSCSMDDEGEISLDCLQRQELNDWGNLSTQAFYFGTMLRGHLVGRTLHQLHQIQEPHCLLFLEVFKLSIMVKYYP